MKYAKILNNLVNTEHIEEYGHKNLKSNQECHLKDKYKFGVDNFVRNTNFTKIVKKPAFTLAEVLVSLVILGLVAVMVIPSTTKKTTERQNRTKIAKAIETYNKLIDKVVIENGITTTSSLNSLLRANGGEIYTKPQMRTYIRGLERGSDEYNAAVEQYNQDLNIYNQNLAQNGCANARKYFNVSDTNAQNKCIFKTKDGLWWNMLTASSTIVAFKEETLLDNRISTIASDYDDHRAFYFTATVDSNGSWRTNYVTSSMDLDNKLKTEKAYDYAFNKVNTMRKCTAERTTNCMGKLTGSSTPVHFGKDGMPDYAYKGCDSSMSNCKCQYKMMGEYKDNVGTYGMFFIPEKGEKSDCVHINSSSNRKCPVLYYSYSGRIFSWECEGMNDIVYEDAYNEYGEYIDIYLGD